MTKKVKQTITMPAKMADKWLEALRSGKYKQGKGALYQNTHYSDKPEYAEYCCLGVLQKCTTGRVQKHLGLPTKRWLRANKIDVVGSTNCIIEEVDILLDPPIISKKTIQSVSELNDSGHLTSKQIANILDKRIKRI